MRCAITLLLLAAIGLVAGSEVISADQGAATAAPTRYSSGSLTADRFQAVSYSNSGANGGTVWVMMAAVSLGYAALFFVLFSTCLFRSPQPVAVAVAGPASAGAFAFQRFPEMDVESPYKIAPVAELDATWRKAFIGKVYTLLAVQILITLLISVGMMVFGGFDFYIWTVTAGSWTRLAAILVTFLTIIPMICYKSRYPLNLLLLLLFTVTMGYTIGVTCTAYAAAGMQMLVVEAFAITSLIFIALTIFTMQSKIDFSFLGAVLPVMLFTLVIWGLFSMIAFPSFAMVQVYALAGSVIFSLYILYDTWMITTYLSYDDYVLGAINLYLDFVNLFLMILQLLMGMRRD